jgi:hypothetical protein
MCMVCVFHKGTDILFFWHYVHVGASEITDLCSGGCIISMGKDQTMYILAERQANLSQRCPLYFPLLNLNLLISNTKSGGYSKISSSFT